MDARIDSEALVPCGHVESTMWMATSDSGLAFCTRCQRGYEFAPRPDPAGLNQQFIREALAYSLL